MDEGQDAVRGPLGPKSPHWLTESVSVITSTQTLRAPPFPAVTLPLGGSFLPQMLEGHSCLLNTAQDRLCSKHPQEIIETRHGDLYLGFQYEYRQDYKFKSKESHLGLHSKTLFPGAGC